MPPALDQPKTLPTADQAADAADLVEAFRDRLGLPASRPGLALSEPEPAAAADVGRGVLDCLDVRSSGVVPVNLSPDATRRFYEDLGRRFADYVLPAAADLGRTDAAVVVLYHEALKWPKVEAGLLAAAFGAARLGAFGSDRMLVYRFKGYRGRPGLPLADHLIAAVVRPAVGNLAGPK